MAAPAGKMVGVSDDSSSSDDEALRRCQEAVWETRPKKDKEDDSDVKQSKRVVVADHDHDGNELQVSQGFRTHVAKKLGSLLDSCITETQTKPSSCVESSKCDDDDNDGGFRLFSTSVPGQAAQEPPAPVRRRPLPSSSDSDSEMETRLREAAVAIKDLLPSSALPSTPPTPSTEPPCSEKIKKKKKKKATEGEESHVVKKKKKRKEIEEDGEQVDCDTSLDSRGNGEVGNSEQENTQVKVKRKKKKKRKENTEEEAVN